MADDKEGKILVLQSSSIANIYYLKMCRFFKTCIFSEAERSFVELLQDICSYWSDNVSGL